ncbi:MAG: hypothetical protein GY940_00325, partial [bacterium]|nr:hypothetical protein [bacterium]
KDIPKDFSEVWKTHPAENGIYFDTSKALIRWKSGRMKVWRQESGFSFVNSFCVGGTIFVHDKKQGLMKIVNDSPQLIAGGETFATDRIYMMTPYDSQKVLIGTRSKGFYIYDGKTAAVFPTDADDYLKKNQLYHGTRLFSGDFALATRLGGIVIIDSSGKLKDIFNKAYGLQDDMVRYIFEDFQDNLWLAMNQGISKIEYASPIS